LLRAPIAIGSFYLYPVDWIGDRMLAVIYERSGEPKAVLKVHDVPTPKPAPNQVLLRMIAMPINPADLATIRGVYRTPQKTPTVPGYEGLGEIVETGAAVASLSVGQKVIVIACKPAGWSNGTWQEHMVVEEAGVLPIPDGVDLEAVPQFFNTILTPWVMCVNELNLGPGQVVVLTAAGSGVGKLILRLSKVRDFKVIAVVRRPEQVEEIKALGAFAVICSSQEDITKRVMAITDLKGVDAALDSVGGEVSSQCFRALADWGQMLVYGLLDLERNASYDVRKMLFYNLKLKGFWLPGWWSKVPLKERTIAVNKCFELMKEQILIPQVQQYYPISEIEKAVLHSERPGNVGRIMLKPEN
jgi:NADPH:quinone reductase